MSDEALYRPDGEVMVPSRLVTSPWSQTTSHGGPPSGLLARAIQMVTGDELRLSRITVEFLRPVPMAPLAVTAAVVRPGAKVALAEAEIRDTSGNVLALARGWSLRERTDLPMYGTDAPPLPMPHPDTLPEPDFLISEWTHFPINAEDLRLAGGDLGATGRAAVWFRLRVPLVADEETTPEQQVAIAADSANGLSRHAETSEMLFVNTDLTVHLARRPIGSWVGIDATSHWFPSGRGLSDTAVYDLDGYLGRSNQTLFIDEAHRAARPQGPQEPHH